MIRSAMAYLLLIRIPLVVPKAGGGGDHEQLLRRGLQCGGRQRGDEQSGEYFHFIIIVYLDLDCKSFQGTSWGFDGMDFILQFHFPAFAVSAAE